MDNSDTRVITSIQAEKQRRTGKLAFSVVFQLVLLGLVVSVFVVTSAARKQSLKKQDATISQLEKSIAEEMQLSEGLQEELAYGESDRYIEKAARDRLGYIKHDEIKYIIAE